MSTPKKPSDGVRIPSIPSMPAVDVRFRPGSVFTSGPAISLPPPAQSIPPQSGATPTISGMPGANPSSNPPSLAPTQSIPAAARPVSPRSRLSLIVMICGAVAGLVLAAFALGRSGRVVLPSRAAAPSFFAERVDVSQFQRGNLHTHSTRSDGRQPPEEMAAWYRDHGYQFLVLSEHDVLIDSADLETMEAPGFVMIPGEEISSQGDDKPVHVLALCIGDVIASGRFSDTRSALLDAVGAVRHAGGVPVVNHPNFQWALTTSDVAALHGDYALEIWSGHPEVNTLGSTLRPSHEELWDELLTRGRDVSAVAVDDAHTLMQENTASATPGHGWVQTFGGETSRKAICTALAGGQYYASSGVAFRRIRVTESSLTVWVDDATASVDFVGNGGAVLASTAPVADEGGFVASYALRGGESYVRARASVKGHGQAWTQAYRTIH
jgi:hypothetical protein